MFSSPRYAFNQLSNGDADTPKEESVKHVILILQFFFPYSCTRDILPYPAVKSLPVNMLVDFVYTCECLCMCLCMHLSLCACVCTHAHVCANVCLYACACGYVHMWVGMNVSVCVYMSICIYVSMCACACLDTHTHVCKPECAWPVCICTRVCVHVCTHVPTCVCQWACVCILSPSSRPSSSASIYLAPLTLITDAVWQTQINHQCVCAELLRDSMGCSPPGSSVHRDSPGKNTRVAAVPSSRGSSHPRDQTQVFRITGRFFTLWATTEAQTISLWFNC